MRYNKQLDIKTMNNSHLTCIALSAIRFAIGAQYNFTPSASNPFYSISDIMLINHTK